MSLLMLSFFGVLHVRFMCCILLFMCCSCVFRHQCHASRNRHKVEAENKGTITHIREKNISLVEFSRLDGKIKLPKGTLIAISQIETYRV